MAGPGELKMKIAIPVWQDRVSPLFDSSEHLLVAESAGNRILKQDVISMESLSLFQRIDLLQRLHIEVFACGGITRPILENISNKNIKVIPFICGDVNELLQAILNGKDVKFLFSMPGKSEKEKNK
jgi:predicted Fe-Mo cluster-binding NifX family protein